MGLNQLEAGHWRTIIDFLRRTNSQGKLGNNHTKPNFSSECLEIRGFECKLKLPCALMCTTFACLVPNCSGSTARLTKRIYFLFIQKQQPYTFEQTPIVCYKSGTLCCLACRTKMTERMNADISFDSQVQNEAKLKSCKESRTSTSFLNQWAEQGDPMQTWMILHQLG